MKILEFSKILFSQKREVKFIFGGKFDVFGDFQHFWGSFTEIRCNVPIELPSLGSYTSDVVCITDCGEMFVREWVFRQRISIPMTIKLLDASRECWIRRGVKDWGIVTDEKNDLLKFKNQIVRILNVKEDQVFVIDCVNRTVPQWRNAEEFKDFLSCTREEFYSATNMKELDFGNLDESSKKFAHERYTLIAPKT